MSSERDSYQAMLDIVQAFHDKHDFKNKGGEELTYRMALMAEELGEMGACITKGKPVEELAEETADLFILLTESYDKTSYQLLIPGDQIIEYSSQSLIHLSSSLPAGQVRSPARRLLDRPEHVSPEN